MPKSKTASTVGAATQVPGINGLLNGRGNNAKADMRVTVGMYLIQRLQEYNIRHVFGIPGDYVLGFYDLLQNSPIKVVGTTREDCAGFAADGYARVHGMGAVCVTYCVGGLNVTNPIAGAYAEKSPVVLISGSPGLKERHRDPLLHHKVRTFTTQREIFEKITCASTVLEDASTACSEIDRVLAACHSQKRPVYIEIPRDIVDESPAVSAAGVQPAVAPSDKAALEEAVSEALEMLNRAKNPVILADVEIHRFGLQRHLLELLENTGYPIAATILGKSVIGELHPNYIGVYEGAMGRPEVTAQVENSDCLLMLGTFLTDINLGIFTAQLDRARVIEATSEKVQIRHHSYPDIRLDDFLMRLMASPLKKRRPPRPNSSTRRKVRIVSDEPMTVQHLYARLNELLTPDMVVVSDVGDCLFGAVDLVIHERTEFIASAYYTSMGFAIPAALGVQCANKKLRPLVLVGDGAFQMTGMELSTIARLGLDPIVIILNNRGYTTERFIKEGPYNNILDWHYHKLPEVLGAGRGYHITTHGDFEKAWRQATSQRGSFSLLNVVLEQLDHSPALERLGQRLAENLRSPSPLS